MSKEHLPQNSRSPAFLYGESIFTTSLVQKGRMLFFEEHIERLAEGIAAYYVGKELDPAQVEALAGTVRSFLERETGQISATKRLRITVAGPERGELFWKEFDFERLRFDFQLSEREPDERPLALKTFPSPFSRHWPALKMGSYMPFLYLKMRAARNGFDDALLTDERGRMLEGASSNLFFHKGDRLFAPRNCLLNGVVKRAVEKHWPVEKLDLPVGRAGEFDGAFLTNSAWIARPVQSIDRVKFKDLNRRLVRDMVDNILKAGFRE